MVKVEGKNIFGYTAPPRKKKNGKEGYYPRYISYRCISSMLTIPESVELISQKIDIQTDVNSLRKKRTAIQNEITKYNGNLLQMVSQNTNRSSSI